MRLASLAVLAIALVAGTTSAAEAPAVTCESIVTPVGAFSWRPKRVVVGVVAVPPAYIPQTAPTGKARLPFWSKAGLVVRADSPLVTVTVPKRWRQRVAIGWGNVDGTTALRIATCPDASSLGGWNPYSGGFQLRERAACVPLTFRVGNESATVRFGVGRRCG